MNQRLKPILALLILVSILGFDFLTPLSANAQEATSVSTALIGGSICAVSGILSDWLARSINNGLRKLGENLFWNSTNFGFLGRLLLENTVPINDEANDTREGVLDLVARCFARELMNDLTARITGAVRTSGRENRLGAPDPSFVRDWRKFLTNAQHRGENIFRSTLNSTVLCPQFSGPLKTLFQANNQPNISNFDTRVGNLDSFRSRAQCSMPAGWNIQNYRSDFAGNGGWEALSRMSRPENNFYGTFLLSMTEVAVQRGLEQLGDEREAVAGKGFTSRRAESIISAITGQPAPLSHCSQDARRVCTTNTDCANVVTSGNCVQVPGGTTFQCDNMPRACTTPAVSSSECTTLPSNGFCVADPVQTQTRSRCKLYATNGKCILYNDILTPGSVIGDAFNSTVAEELAWLTNADEWNEIVQYMMTTLMSRVLNLSEPSTYNQEIFGEEEYPTPFDRDFNAGGTTPPTTTPPGGPQCNDNQDNDGDGLVDFPADLGCIDLLDTDESTVPTAETQGRFCTDVDFEGSCWTLGVGNYTVPVNNSIPAGSFSLPIPNDSMSSALIPAGFEADICSDANYGACYTVTGRTYDSNLATSGSGVPSDWPGTNDTTSSIRIRSTTGPTPTPTAGPPPTPPVTNCTTGGSCLTVQYFPIGQNSSCTDNCISLAYTIAAGDISGGYASGRASLTIGSYTALSMPPNLAAGSTLFPLPSPTPAWYVFTIQDTTLNSEVLRVLLYIPPTTNPPPSPTIPPITPTPVPTPYPQCSDGSDNDGDGLTDWSSTQYFGDPECSSPSDDSESIL